MNTQNPEVQQNDSIIHQESSNYNTFDDIKTKTEWECNVEMKFNDKREALIQIVGNWRLLKYRKSYDSYECM